MITAEEEATFRRIVREEIAKHAPPAAPHTVIKVDVSTPSPISEDLIRQWMLPVMKQAHEEALSSARKWSAEEILDVMAKSMRAAGIIRPSAAE